VRTLPPEQQVEAVAARLKELNPGFDGKLTHKIAGGKVFEVQLAADEVTDLSPIRALADLRRLHCCGSAKGKGRFSDLSPLRGMPLTTLYCWDTSVKDLTPLQGMPLKVLLARDIPATDLTPLRELPLETLHLTCSGLDLTPLRSLPLKSLNGIKPGENLSLLKSLWALERINLQPALDFWKQHDPKRAAFLQWVADTKNLSAQEQVKAVTAKLQELNPGYDGASPNTIENGRVIGLSLASPHVTDIAPLRALVGLNRLNCSNSSVADLSPLHGLPLTELRGAGTKVVDLSPLSGMPLQVLTINGTRVADLSPLRGMPLTKLICNHTRVADLAPLRGLPLADLNCDGTPVADFSPLQTVPLKELVCDKLRPERDAGILRSIKTLEKINGQPAAEFWKAVDARKP